MKLKIEDRELLKTLEEKLSEGDNKIKFKLNKLTVKCGGYCKVKHNEEATDFWREYSFTPDNGDCPEVIFELERDVEKE